VEGVCVGVLKRLPNMGSADVSWKIEKNMLYSCVASRAF